MEYVEIARAESERGELVLRERRAENAPTSLELRANGVFVMDTARGEHRAGAGRARRSAAVDDPRAVVVGGLGLGFTMHEVLADRRVERCAVVEIEQALVDWMRDGTVPHGPALLADERVTVVVADIAVALAEATPASYDLVLLDVDNGPGYLVHDANAALYRAPFLRDRPHGAAARRRAGRSGRPREAPELRGGAARRCSARRDGAAARRAAAGPRGAVLALRRAGTVRRMSDDDFRIEHDSMGEVRVPARRAVAGPDPAGRRELPDQRHPDRAGADPRDRAGEGRRGDGQRRARRPRRRSRPHAIVAAAAGGRRRASTTTSSRSTSSRPGRAPAPT